MYYDHPGYSAHCLSKTEYGSVQDAVETNQETQTTEKAENQTEGGYDLSKKEFNVRITVGDTQLMATLENNATTQYLVQQMPLTLPMEDLYDREMCYRYGANALPVEHLQTDAYEVGDLAYWARGWKCCDPL